MMYTDTECNSGYKTGSAKVLMNWECKSAYGTGSEEQTATEQNGQIKVIGFYSKKEAFSQCWG